MSSLATVPFAEAGVLARGDTRPPEVGRRDSLRVLMVTSDYPADARPRTTHFIKRQADFLRAAGVNVDVFHFEGNKRLLNYARAWRRLRPHLERGGYDLVHAQFGQSGLLALPKRLPIVVTLRGSDILGIVDDRTGRYTAKGRLLQRLSREVARRADAVILVSEHMREVAGRTESVHVIPSGLDLGLFRPIPRDEARQRLELSPTKRLVLFVGRPNQARKRFDLAKRAVELLDRALPAELVLASCVQHTEIPYYMAACDALIFTSMQEGSPNVVKEALACNLPVVSVAVGDVETRLAGIDGCELCRDDRPEALAAALERVLRRERRTKSRARVAHLDETLLTQKVIAIYESVLAGRPAGAIPGERAVTSPDTQSNGEKVS
jgi:teichuronic acid biosynthesis glycosyltransferase TuaC